MPKKPPTDLSLLPAIPDDVAAFLEKHLGSRRAKRPFVELVFAPAGSSPTRMTAAELADLRRYVSDVMEQAKRHLDCAADLALAQALGFTDRQSPAWLQNPMRWQLFQEVFMAPGGKGGGMQLQKLSQDSSAHETLRQAALDQVAFRSAWAPVMARLDMARAVLLTREDCARARAEAAVAGVSPARLLARPKIAAMLDEVTRESLDTWAASFVPEQSRQLLQPAERFARESKPGETVLDFARRSTRLDAHKAYSSGWYAAEADAAELGREISRFYPLEPTGRAKADEEARRITQDLRTQFLAKMSDKIASAECEDRVTSLTLLNPHLTQGRLAAKLRVEIGGGGAFSLVTESVVKWAPRSRYAFAQYPTRFVDVLPPGEASTAAVLAVVAESEMALVLRNVAVSTVTGQSEASVVSRL